MFTAQVMDRDRDHALAIALIAHNPSFYASSTSLLLTNILSPPPPRLPSFQLCK